jgi:esterase/lipase superfamily enzyme
VRPLSPGPAAGAVNREYHRWYSPSLRRDMEMLVFGHGGSPVIVFPTSMGRFFEFEDRSMVGELSGQIDAGQIQLYCVDSVDQESWYNRGVHPGARIARHLEFERYILDEVWPLMRSRLPEHADQRMIATGCSLGAFHAAMLAFRHPGAVSRLIALSGKYENSTFLHGYSDDQAYLTNPLAFLPGLTDPAYLDPMRAMDIVIVTGSADPHVEEAMQLSRVLWDKGVPNTLDVWDGWMHDWPYWKAMIRKFL